MKKSQLIGVIVPDISSYFTGEILNGVEEIGKMYNYDILLCNTYGELEQELRYLNLLKSKQVEGIIFMTNKLNDKHKKFIKDSGLPVVMINRNSSDPNIPSICIDHYLAAYQMTNYLIKNGHKKIALIRNGIENDVFGVDQYNGYSKALSENGLEVDERLIRNGDFKMDEAYKCVQSILDEGLKPTAIFATTDVMAIGVMNCLFDNNLRVPEDVSVAGFNDIKLASIYRPKLTTIKQPIYDIGAVAIRLIIKKINGEDVSENIVTLPHELVERDSCRTID